MPLSGTVVGVNQRCGQCNADDCLSVSRLLRWILEGAYDMHDAPLAEDPFCFISRCFLFLFWVQLGI